MDVAATVLPTPASGYRPTLVLIIIDGALPQWLDGRCALSGLAQLPNSVRTLRDGRVLTSPYKLVSPRLQLARLEGPARSISASRYSSAPGSCNVINSHFAFFFFFFFSYSTRDHVLGSSQSMCFVFTFLGNQTTYSQPYDYFRASRESVALCTKLLAMLGVSLFEHLVT